ncbi:MAG: efflux RND transporter periplasmic adaptor subunit [Ignavibacteriae bacterium]|nr:efflux RND transporter periplasmic adaptor subunit [Ignavibacteriota bacterium]
MKNKKQLIIFIIVVIILLLIFFPKLNLNENDEMNKNDGGKKNESIVADIKIIKPESLQNKIFTNGTLIGNEEVLLRSESSGKVTAILFDEGKKVKKGELLLKINDEELQATLKKNSLKVDFAKDKEFRARQLLEKQLTSQQEYDIVLNELNSLKADVEFTIAQIAKTEIRAPFDGIIGLRSVSIGSYITPQIQVATIQSINPIKIDFAVPQKYYSEIKEGKIIEFAIPSVNKNFIGKIYAVEPKIDQTTRTILVRAIADNNNGILLPGAYVEINIILENMLNAILIPTDALIPDMEGEKVFLFKNGKAIPQKVTTGIRTESKIQITEGLEMGDSVIVSGIIQLRPNMQIKIKLTK